MDSTTVINRIVKSWITFFSFIFLLPQIAFSQTFSKRYEFPFEAAGNSGYGIELVNGNYVIDGVGNDIQLLQAFGIQIIDASGDLVETLNYAIEGYNQFGGYANPSVVNEEGSGYCTVFTSDSIGLENGNECTLLVFNSEINELNSYSVVNDDSNWEHWNQVIYTSNNGYALIGITNNSEDGQDAIVIRKLNENSELEWVRLYESENNNGDSTVRSGHRIHNAPNDGFMIGGLRTYIEEFGGCDVNDYKKNAYFMRIDQNGDILWEIEFDDCYTQLVPSLSKLANGDYILGTAIFNDELSDGFNNWRKHRLVRINDNGDTVWDKTYGDETILSQPFKTLEMDDGSLMTLALQWGPSLGQVNGVILKTTAEGDSLWHRHYRFADDTPAVLFDFIQTPDNGFAACGWTYPSEGYDSQDMWLLKLNENGCLTDDCSEYTNINEIERPSFNFSIGPNPASETVYIDLSTDSQLGSEFYIQIFDLRGVMVDEILNISSNSSIVYDVQHLSTGCYFLNLIRGQEKLETKKLVVE